MHSGWHGGTCKQWFGLKCQQGVEAQQLLGLHICGAWGIALAYAVATLLGEHSVKPVELQC